jgi:tripartite ATP-independent transporter DctM subunit
MELLAVSVLIISFFGLLLIGVPVAYSIGLSTMLTMLVSVMPLPAATTVAQRVATGIDSFALLAIPFFILAGELMNRGGIAERLIAMAKAIVGRLPGGLAYVNVVAAMLFGAVAGSAVAATSAIGGIMTPRMEKEGYDRGYSAAVNITSSTTGLLIPPSNILIIYSLASGGVSIATLFIAGYIPGLLVGACLIGAAAILAVKRGYSSGEPSSLKEVVTSTFRALPSLIMLVVVIGGIVAGSSPLPKPRPWRSSMPSFLVRSTANSGSPTSMGSCSGRHAPPRLSCFSSARPLRCRGCSLSKTFRRT